MPSDSAGIITSIHNPSIKRARSLLRRKRRHEERAFLIEGIRSVADVIEAGVAPEVVFARVESGGHDWANTLDERVPVRFVSAEVLASISNVVHPQGVVAVVGMDAMPALPIHDPWTADLVMVVDGVADPGNLGTLVRSAAAAGVSELLVSPESVDPFHPKCIRAAMGAHFRTCLKQVTIPEIVSRIERLPLVVIASANGDQAYDKVDWRQPCAIVVGSEAFGPRSSVSALATAYVRIPMARDLESLNAGVAGSLLAFEAARHRRHASLDH